MIYFILANNGARLAELEETNLKTENSGDAWCGEIIYWTLRGDNYYVMLVGLVRVNWLFIEDTAISGINICFKCKYR